MFKLPHMQAAVTNEPTQARGIAARSQDKHGLISLPQEAPGDSELPLVACRATRRAKGLPAKGPNAPGDQSKRIG